MATQRQPRDRSPSSAHQGNIKQFQTNKMMRYQNKTIVYIMKVYIFIIRNEYFLKEY